MYEESLKVAAQPDPSLKPRAAHTHSLSKREGRDHTRRAAEAQISRFTPRRSTVDGAYGPEGFLPQRSVKEKQIFY